MRMERRPTSVIIREESTIMSTVSPEVFHKSLELLSLFTATIALVKISGTTMYLPTRIKSSVRKAIAFAKAAFSVGRIKAASTPKATPSKYLIQTFISKYYNTVFTALQNPYSKTHIVKTHISPLHCKATRKTLKCLSNITINKMRNDARHEVSTWQIRMFQNFLEVWFLISQL